jgi:hypothetical protein
MKPSISVALGIAVVLACSARTTPPPAGDGSIDHQPFTELLAEHVRDGRVFYAALCHDGRLESYLSALAAVDPSRLPDDQHRLAFWINTYNAFTLKIICDNFPLKSINDLHFGGLVVGTVLNKTIWDKKFVVINDEELSLNNIEHDIIRKEFADPRIHFALVCAAKSCPPLRREAFEPEMLDEQLNDQGRLFFSDRDKNWFDLEKKVAHLSKIMDWYRGDFGSNRAEMLTAVAPFLPDDVAKAVVEDVAEWRVSHLDYDWSLND